MNSSYLFDLDHTIASPLLSGLERPWEALSELHGFILSLGAALSGYAEIAPNVWAADSADIMPSAYIVGPCIIGPRAQVRHCAFIRGDAIIGADAVVGNSTELKNAILFDNVQVPHYNYVGDSILGFHAHMGAGAVTSNVRADRANVMLHLPNGDEQSGMRKLGALLGDYVEVGCNSVLNPGAIIGRRTMVYPLSCVRGVVPADSIYKTGGVIVGKS